MNEAYAEVGEVAPLHELNDEWLAKLPVGTKLYAAIDSAKQPVTSPIDSQAK